MSNKNQGNQLLLSASICVAISLYATNSIVAAPPQVQLAKLNNWRFLPDTKKLEITLSEGKTPQYFYLNEPPRLVIDIPETKLGSIPTQQTYTGAVQRVRVSQLSPEVTRIVLDLAPGNAVDMNQVQLQQVSRKNTTRWVLRPTIVKAAAKTNNVGRAGGTASASNQPANIFNYLQLPSSISPNTFKSQPFVSVPALNSKKRPQTTNSPQTQPNSSNQSGTFNSANSSNPTPPPLTNYPVIEFGQPLPK